MGSTVYNPVSTVRGQLHHHVPKSKAELSLSVLLLPHPPTYKQPNPFACLLMKNVKMRVPWLLLSDTQHAVTFPVFSLTRTCPKSVLCASPSQPSIYPHSHLKVSITFSRIPDYFPNTVLFSKLCTYCPLELEYSPSAQLPTDCSSVSNPERQTAHWQT